VNEITADRLVLTKGQPTEMQFHGFCGFTPNRELPQHEYHTPKFIVMWSFTLSTIGTENNTCIEFEVRQNFVMDRLHDCAITVSNSS
jgi:hypothetical protein